MAEAPNTNSTAAVTKRVYAKNGEDMASLKFELGILGELLAFKTGEKTGDTYNFPAALTMEHGVLYNGTTGAGTTLAESVAAVIKQASVTAYEFVEKARITHRLMHDAIASGDAAFAAATGLVLTNLMASAEYRQEHSLLYGQEGLFRVDGNSSGVLTIDPDTWSAALADGLEGAILEAFTTTAATATQHNGDLVVTAVDLEAKTITVSGTSAAVVADDILYFKGAKTTTGYNEMMGVHKMLNTVTGDVNGISTTTYSRWRPNVKSSFGVPQVASFLAAISKITGRRVRKKEMNVLLPVHAFDRVASDIQQSRRYDAAKKTAVAGFEAISLVSSLGEAKFIPHAMVRDADAMAFSGSNGFRIGSKELGWSTPPGGDKSDIWQSINTNLTYEVRVSSIEQPAFLRPHETLGISGVTIG